MNDYILARLRCDASYVLDLARLETRIQHTVVKGRLRELLVENLLKPWLPPFIACGTGVITDHRMHRTESQEDIVVYDQTLAPPILAQAAGKDGVFLLNSVIARVEVKSTLTLDDIRRFVDSSVTLSQLELAVGPEYRGSVEGPYNVLFAYESDLDAAGNARREIERLIGVMQQKGIPPESGVVSMLCIPGRGFWRIGLVGNAKTWVRIISNDSLDYVAYFVACISNTCYRQHGIRQGYDPSPGITAGIGTFLDYPFEEI